MIFKIAQNLLTVGERLNQFDQFNQPCKRAIFRIFQFYTRFIAMKKTSQKIKQQSRSSFFLLAFGEQAIEMSVFKSFLQLMLFHYLLIIFTQFFEIDLHIGLFWSSANLPLLWDKLLEVSLRRIDSKKGKKLRKAN